jgi:hypothetical protein
MKKASLVLSFLLVFSLFSLLSTSKASSNDEIKVGVFYYPWYYGGNHIGHWNGHPKDYNINLSDTWWTVNDEPYLGWYASDDTAVIDQHLRWFEYAGIDFGIISWWGPYLDKRVFDDKWVEVLLDETNNYAPWFRWVVSIEGGQPQDWQVLRNWVYENYTKKYPQIWLNDPEKNEPFLFWMNSDITNDNVTRQFIEADHDFSVRILGQANYSDWMTWRPYTDSGATRAFLPKNGFMCVMPRYDERGLAPDRNRCADPYLDGSDGQNVEPLNGEPLYDKQWKEVFVNALAGDVKYVGIATWNDFTERTQIEPCYDNTSAYKDDPFFLLNKTKHYTTQLRTVSTLQDQLNSLNDQLNYTRDWLYALTATTAILIVTTAYFAVRKLKRA